VRCPPIIFAGTSSRSAAIARRATCVCAMAACAQASAGSGTSRDGIALGPIRCALTYGWTDTEAAAIQAAKQCIYDLAAGRAGKGIVSHGSAAHRLKELNRAKRRARPAPATTDARPTEYLFAEHSYDPDWPPYERVWSIRAFPIVRKTKKRIYYKLRWLEWIREIDAPDLSEPQGIRVVDMRLEEAIAFADREELERTGRTTKYGGNWGSVLRDDYELFLKPPAARDLEPEIPDLRQLKAAMAAAHPDRGGSTLHSLRRASGTSRRAISYGNEINPRGTGNDAGRRRHRTGWARSC
jgi:hypothetical protein